MHKLRSYAAAFVFAAGSAAPALAQGDTGGAQHPVPMAGQDEGVPTRNGGKTPRGADAEFRHGMMTMQHEMNNMKMTGDPDRDFVMMMIPHHRGAVEMAQVELKYGKDPELRKLAQDIIDAQKREISFMEDWQSKQKK